MAYEGVDGLVRYVVDVYGDGLQMRADILFHHPDKDAPGEWSGAGGGPLEITESLCAREFAIPRSWPKPRWNVYVRNPRLRR